MRPTTLLTHLVICASTGHAFIPFLPAWKEKLEDEAKPQARIVGSKKSLAVEDGVFLNLIRRARGEPRSDRYHHAHSDAERLAIRYAERKGPNYSSIVARDNQFKIDKSTETNSSMTAGVDQDGTDYSYFVQVQMGSKGTELYMLIDTGAGSSWLMGPDCQSDACQNHNSFGPDDSDTFEASKDEFSISYGTGKVSGVLATDTIGVAGMSFKYQFGLASETSDDFQRYAFDGILGLAMIQGANENFLKTAEEANALKTGLFAVALSRAQDGSNDGEISFGKTNSAKYSGDITYTSLSTDGEWAIDCDEISYDGKKAGVGGIPAYIDTGTSFIFGPPDAVKKVHATIPGAETSDGQSYLVPCDSNKSLNVTFSGKSFEISPKDWISPQNVNGKCTSNIYGMSVVDGAWLFGDTFLKNVYTVFDMDQKRIGFAARAGDSTAAATSTSKAASASITGSATATATSADRTPGPSKTATLMGLGGPEKPSSTSSAPPSQTSKKGAAAGTQLSAQQLMFLLCVSSLLGLVL